MWASQRYRGQPLDFSTRRSIRLLNEQHGWMVENFFHEGRFWVAKIPQQVQHVVGQAFNFSRPRTRPGANGPEVIYDPDGVPRRTITGLNHVQCRFVMDTDSPIELYGSAEELERGAVTHQVFDMVYSIEAVGPSGVRFNFRDAMTGALFCAHRFMSTTEMVFERIALEGQHVIQSAPLEISAEDKQELLKRSIARAHQAGDDERYYMIGLWGTNNCTSNPFRILDDVVSYPFPYWLGAFIYRLPVRPRLYLWIRGLDHDPLHRLQLREEFKEYLSSKEVRQRKRAFIRSIKEERKRKQDEKAQEETAQDDANSDG